MAKKKNRMRRWVLVGAAVVLGVVLVKAATVAVDIWVLSRSVPDDMGSPDPMEPLFLKYDLAEYEVTERDVVRGLGGRLISLRYELKEGAGITREEMADRVVAALTAAGWDRKEGPARPKPVLGKMWPPGGKDLHMHFARGPRDDEPDHYFFAQTIHISDDASVLCAYCEAGW